MLEVCLVPPVIIPPGRIKSPSNDTTKYFLSTMCEISFATLISSTTITLPNKKLTKLINLSSTSTKSEAIPIKPA